MERYLGAPSSLKWLKSRRDWTCSKTSLGFGLGPCACQSSRFATRSACTHDNFIFGYIAKNLSQLEFLVFYQLAMIKTENASQSEGSLYSSCMPPSEESEQAAMIAGNRCFAAAVGFAGRQREVGEDTMQTDDWMCQFGIWKVQSFPKKLM